MARTRKTKEEIAAEAEDIQAFRQVPAYNRWWLTEKRKVDLDEFDTAGLYVRRIQTINWLFKWFFLIFITSAIATGSAFTVYSKLYTSVVNEEEVNL